MNLLKKSFLIVLLPLFAFTVAHKFYLSVTNIVYSKKDDALQVTMRIFVEDLEKVLEERYDIKTYLDSDKESELAKEYIEKYLRAKFVIYIDGKKRSYDFIGIKYDTDIIMCYLEVSKINLPKIRSIVIQNEVLTDIYDEQQNVVHFKINKKKKSFVLTKSDTKGMLNL